MYYEGGTINGWSGVLIHWALYQKWQKTSNEVLETLAPERLSHGYFLCWYVSTNEVEPPSHFSRSIWSILVNLIHVTLVAGLFTGSFVTLFSVYVILAHITGMFSSATQAAYMESVYPVFRYFFHLAWCFIIQILNINNNKHHFFWQFVACLHCWACICSCMDATFSCGSSRGSTITLSSNSKRRLLLSTEMLSSFALVWWLQLSGLWSSTSSYSPMASLLTKLTLFPGSCFWLVEFECDLESIMIYVCT